MSHHLPAMTGMAPSDISIAPLNFASLSSPSSLTNSYMLLIGIRKIIRNLARYALATVPGRRRRVFFLVRLKNRRILSLRFLCLSCNAHDSGSLFFCSRKMKNLELLQSSTAGGCGRWSSQGALYRRQNLGELTACKAQGRNVKQNKFCPIPKGTFNFQIHAAP